VLLLLSFSHMSPAFLAPHSFPVAAVKAAGKWRQEGKTYEVLDGDIIHW
jgi:ribosome-binding ATPase YchF (GTP1/OBG family)